MKKVTVIILTAILLLTTLAFPVSAAATINDKLDAEYIKTPPKVDGKINAAEYGIFPALTYSKDKYMHFQAIDDHDDYNNWDFDFYIAWDDDNLYMAWDVKTDVHQPLVKGTYDNNGNLISKDWPSDGSMLSYMWMFSCIELMITPGAPKNGSTNYDGNYLAIGICQLDDGSVGRAAWSYPKGISASDVSLNSWDAAVTRSGKHTIYELAIPWRMSGIAFADDNKQFGLSFAVAAQENYNVKRGMIEWNDAILGGKSPNKAGVITLNGATCEFPENPNIITEGARPADSNGKVIFDIDYINRPLSSESTALKTDINYEIHTHWAYALLLEPVSGNKNLYTIIDKRHGEGVEIAFSQYKSGMLILGIHTDCWDENRADNYPNYYEQKAAVDLPLGTQLVLWGVDVTNGEFLYSNAMMYAPFVYASDLGSDMSEDEYYSEAESEVIEEYESEVIEESRYEDHSYSNKYDKEEYTKDNEENEVEDIAPIEEKSSFAFAALLPILIIIGAVIIPIVFIVILVVVIILATRKKK